MIVGRLRLVVAEASTSGSAPPPTAGAEDRPRRPARALTPADLPAAAGLGATGVDQAARLAAGDLGVIVEEDGQPVGLIWWALTGHPDAHMGRQSRAGGGVAIGNQFLVDPAYRNRGIGHDLLVGSLPLLADAGVTRGRLLIGLSNRASRASAAAAGFREVATVLGLRVGPRSLAAGVPRRSAPPSGSSAPPAPGKRPARKHSAETYAKRIVGQVASHPSNQAHPRRAVARAVAWQVWKRVACRPIDVAFHGLALRCHPDSQSASNIWYFTPRYDHDEMLFVERYLRPGDDVLDVGANIGTYTLLAAALTAPDGRVTSFEPDPTNATRLRENVALNDLGDRVTVHEAAVTATDGTVEFLADHDVSNAILRPGHRRGSVRSVPSRALDSAVGDPSKVALAKVDIEGAEVDALRGAAGMLGAGRPPVLLIEVLAHQLRRFDTTWDDLAGVLAGHGYRAWTYDADDERLAEVTEPPRGNVLFILDDGLESVRARLVDGEHRIPATPPKVRRAH